MTQAVLMSSAQSETLQLVLTVITLALMISYGTQVISSNLPLFNLLLPAQPQVSAVFFYNRALMLPSETWGIVSIQRLILERLTCVCQY